MSMKLIKEYNTNLKNVKRPNAIKSFWDLEELGRVRLSENYFARDFLYSEISNFDGISNYPQNVELFIIAGSKFCRNILEPLRKTFGNVGIRSGYRSKKLNEHGNKSNLKCGNNKSNYAYHIWDEKDEEGKIGAAVCIFIPWFNDNFKDDKDFIRLAYYLHDNLDYHSIVFFAKQNCFNIGWHEKPVRSIESLKEPKGMIIKDNKILLHPQDLFNETNYKELYKDFPVFKK